MIGQIKISANSLFSIGRKKKVNAEMEFSFSTLSKTLLKNSCKVEETCPSSSLLSCICHFCCVAAFLATECL